MNEQYDEQETWPDFTDRIQSQIHPDNDSDVNQRLQFEYVCRALKESSAEQELVKQRLKWIPVWVVTGITAVLGVAAAAGAVDEEWVYGGVAIDTALIWYYWNNRIGFEKLFNKADIEQFEEYVRWYLSKNSSQLDVRMMADEVGIPYSELDTDTEDSSHSQCDSFAIQGLSAFLHELPPENLDDLWSQ